MAQTGIGDCIRAIDNCAGEPAAPLLTAATSGGILIVHSMMG